MPQLSHRTDLELIAECRSGSESAARAREALIVRHTGLARSIAHRYARRGLPFDDVVQSGYIGLINAVDRYHPGHGVPLERYATRTIEGEIMHLFRDRGWAVRVPRALQESSRRVAAARDELGHRLGARPTVEQIAEHMGEPPEAVVEALVAARAYRAEQLAEGGDEPADSDRRPAQAAITETGYAHVEAHIQAMEAMSVLDPRERAIVALRYFSELTQSEIAQRMGISQMHVSRLLRTSLQAMAAADHAGGAHTGGGQAVTG